MRTLHARLLGLRRGLLTSVLCLAPVPAHAGSFLPLGQLPGGEVESLARGVSDDGGVVVGLSRVFSQSFAAFRWTLAGGMVDLGGLLPSDSRVFALGTNADGSVVVGGSGGASGRAPFVWTASTGMLGLPNIPGGDQNPLGDTNEAIATTPDGSSIVGRSGAMAALWPTGGGVVELFESFSNANAISDDGSVVVGWTSANGWRKVGGGPLEILPLRVANDVSGDGSVIAGRCSRFECRDQAAVWSEVGGLIAVGLLRPGDAFSSFNAVSGDGAVAVGLSGFPSEISPGNAAVIWDAANGLRSLDAALVDEFGIDLQGWRTINATAISPDASSIAGAAVDPDGRIQAFVALLRPQCSDGIDNDSDGAADLDDPSCGGDPEADSEAGRATPVPGRHLLLLPPSRGPRHPWRARTRLHTALALPADALLAHDPTAEPSAVVVRSGADDPEPFVAELAPDRWRRRGQGFAYRDRRGRESAVTHVRLGPGGRLLLAARDDARLPVSPAASPGVEVQLLLGEDAYCALFADETGAFVWARRGFFLAIGADPPARCEPAR